MRRLIRQAAATTFALLVASIAIPAHAGEPAVVYHNGGAGYEDGRPGFDADALTAHCDAGYCAGGIRDDQACSSDSDCLEEPDGLVFWDPLAIHVVGNGYAVSAYDFDAGKYVPVELVISPGTIVKFAHTCELDSARNITSCTPTTYGGGDVGVGIEGTLSIDGALLTDIRDDTAGGDTNKDGSATTPTPSYGLIFGASGRDSLRSSEVRFAREIGRIGSMPIEVNAFKQLGGLSAGFGTGGGIVPPDPGSTPTIFGNEFEIVTSNVNGVKSTVDLRGVCPIVERNFFTGPGTALTIGPMFEDIYYYRGAIPESGTTTITRNTIQTKVGIVTDAASGGGTHLLEQVRFRAEIIDNVLDGPGGVGTVGLRLAAHSDTLAQLNRIQDYATPLLIDTGGVPYPPTAATAALVGLTLHDNTFSTAGVTTGATPAFDAYWDSFATFIDAEHNWWGHQTGPKDTSNADSLANPVGLGLAVSNGIDYSPFRGDAPTDDADSITITATTDADLPLVADQTNVSFTIAATIELETASSASVRVYLRSTTGETLNAPYTSVAVTSADTLVNIGPILVAGIPEYASEIRVEAELVPDGPDGDAVRSNSVAAPVLPTKRSFKLECVSDADEAGTCPSIDLLPANSPLDYPHLKMGFRYSHNTSNVDVYFELSIRDKETGEKIETIEDDDFLLAPGFFVLHEETRAIPISIVAAGSPEREFVILYVARDTDGEVIGRGVRKLPILDDANRLRIMALRALDPSGNSRGTPGHLLVGQAPNFGLDLAWRIGTKNASDWKVTTKSRAFAADGQPVWAFNFSNYPLVDDAATGPGQLDDSHPSYSFPPPPLPADATRYELEASLVSSTDVVVSTSKLSLPVYDAAEVVSKTVPAGASEKSFAPVPAKLNVQTNTNDGLVVMEQIFTPLVDDIPFGDFDSEDGVASLANARIARTTEQSRLIPLDHHIAIYDTLVDSGLSATVTLSYDPEQDFPEDPGFDANTLVVAVRNPLSGKLEALPSTHNTAQHTVTAAYDGFFGQWTIASDTTAPAAGCADPTADGNTTATDALFALRASVGSVVCAPCICDVNGNGVVTTSDALVILRYAVGQSAMPSCVSCS